MGITSAARTEHLGGVELELETLLENLDKEWVGDQSFFTTNFNGTVVHRPNVLMSRDLWVVSVRVNGSDHLIHTFGSQGRGETLEVAFQRLFGELNSLARFYGKGYQFRPSTDVYNVSKI